MDRVLKDNQVKQIISKNYIFIKVDVYNQESLPQKSMITNKTPTFYILKNKKIADKFNTLTLPQFKKRILKNL
jgi:hypothetical protein